MNLRCDDTLLQMYVDGSLGAVERTILDEHIRTCPNCRQTVAAYKGLLWDLEHPVEEPVPAELSLLSDRLMDAWTEAQPAATWQEASMMWTHTVPAVDGVLEAAGRVGRSLPRIGLAGLTGLGRLLLKGGGGR